MHHFVIMDKINYMNHMRAEAIELTSVILCELLLKAKTYLAMQNVEIGDVISFYVILKQM